MNPGYMAGSQGPWAIEISKTYLKFSAAHMTVYPDGTKEALHGHNYQVRVRAELVDASFSKMVDFSKFKVPLKIMCDEFDEKVLLQKLNPHAEIRMEEESCHFKLCGKNYLFPKDEVVVLDLDNISSEMLAWHLANKLVDALKEDGILNWGTGRSATDTVVGIEVGIFETAGQGASYYINKETYEEQAR